MVTLKILRDSCAGSRWLYISGFTLVQQWKNLRKLLEKQNECRHLCTHYEGVTEWSDEYVNDPIHMLQLHTRPQPNTVSAWHTVLVRLMKLETLCRKVVVKLWWLVVTKCCLHLGLGGQWDFCPHYPSLYCITAACPTPIAVFVTNCLGCHRPLASHHSKLKTCALCELMLGETVTAPIGSAKQVYLEACTNVCLQAGPL